MANTVDYLTIANLFAANLWQWNIDGQLKIPGLIDIEATIEKMITVLKESGEDEAQITVGHLVMQRYGDNYDVYVHAGTVSGA
jgi:hypothetical protein